MCMQKKHSLFQLHRKTAAGIGHILSVGRWLKKPSDVFSRAPAYGLCSVAIAIATRQHNLRKRVILGRIRIINSWQPNKCPICHPMCLLAALCGTRVASEGALVRHSVCLFGRLLLGRFLVSAKRILLTTSG